MKNICENKIKVMAKTCLHPDCMHRRFGGGYCVSHQYLRTDKKDKPKRKRIIAKSLKSLYEKMMDRIVPESIFGYSQLNNKHGT